MKERREWKARSGGAVSCQLRGYDDKRHVSCSCQPWKLGVFGFIFQLWELIHHRRDLRVDDPNGFAVWFGVDDGRKCFHTAQTHGAPASGGR